MHINAGELVNSFYQKSEQARSLLKTSQPTEDFYAFILMIANKQNEEN